VPVDDIALDDLTPENQWPPDWPGWARAVALEIGAMSP
jgi:hypothetical protein